MIISGAILCDAYTERRADVRVENGTIVEIGEKLLGDDIIDASGCYFMPALVDTDVRLKDANLNGTNLEKLSHRALKGGVGTVVLASDSNPRIDNEITLEFLQHHKMLESGSTIESTVSALNDEGALSNIAIMLKKGSVAVHTSTITDYNQMSRIAQYLNMAKKPLFYKAVDHSLFDSGVIAEGTTASNLGLPTVSPLSEIVHIASVIEIARHFNIEVIFKSVSEPRSIELIAQAKTEGVNVSCEVGIHHLCKNDEACQGFDSDAKINPPLVSDEKRIQLLKSLRDGNIHSLSSLHQPHSDVQKDVTFFDASYGTTSIEEYLPLLNTYLVDKEGISMSDIVRLASLNPSKQLGKDEQCIVNGSQGDWIIFDPNGTTKVPHHHSLYKNESLKGEVKSAISRGKIVYF